MWKAKSRECSIFNVGGIWSIKSRKLEHFCECSCAVFGEGTFYEAVSKGQPANWCCSTFFGRSGALHFQFKCSSVCIIFFQGLGLSCAAGRRIRTATLTWMWMETTHSSTGNHSIVFERLLLRGSPEVHLPQEMGDNLCPALLEMTQPPPVTVLFVL